MVLVLSPIDNYLLCLDEIHFVVTIKYSTVIYMLNLSLSRIFASLLMFFLVKSQIFAQNKLEGKILDRDGVPFSYSKITITKDTTLLGTQFVDSLGRFAFHTLNVDSVILSIQTPFEKKDTILSLSKTDYFELRLKGDKELEGVTVSTSRPTIIQKIDCVIFNPENIPILAGGNAVDVLKFAPGVYIQGNNIMAAGGKSCQVLLNDKLIPLGGQELISFIYSIPTEDIQYVEIMDVVPLKYAANVSGGLIHIKLRTGAKSRMSNGSIRGSIGQGIYSRGTFGFNYGYKKNKFSLYSNLSGYIGNFRYSTDKEILFPEDIWTEKIKTRYQSQYYTAGLGLNYELSKKTEIGLLFVGRYNIDNFRSHEASNYTSAAGSPISNNDNNSNVLNNGLLNSVTFSLTHTLDTLMKQVSFLVDYSNRTSNDQTRFSNLYQNFFDPDSLKSQQSLTKNGANLLSGGLDFTLPCKHIDITTGIRASLTLNDNNLNVYNTLLSPPLLEDSLNNRFMYEENIQAAYFTIGKGFKKWSFQLGARLENTQTVGNQTTTNQRTVLNYLQVNPQFLLMYKQNENSTWKFNYDRDFYRPGYSELNPFLVYQSAFNRSRGNPYLKPSVHHSVDLSNTFKNLRTSLYYSYGNNGANDVILIDSITLIQNKTIANSEVSHYVSISLSYQIYDLKRWSLNTHFSASYTMTQSNNASVNMTKLTNFGVTFFTTLAYAMDRKKTFFVELSGSWLSPWVQHFESRKMRPDYFIEIKKTFLNKRLSVALDLNNLFNRNRMSSRVTINGITSRTTDFLDAQSVYFHLAYSFGNRNMNVNQKRSGSTGESGRY